MAVATGAIASAVVVGALGAAAAGVLALPIAGALSAAALVAVVGVARSKASGHPVPVPRPDYGAQLAAVVAATTGKVPPAVESRVARVVSILRDTLPRLDQLSGGSHMAHMAVQTATSYMPEALGAYMRLPRDFADKRPMSGGKTSLMVLCDQLDLLAAEMDKVFVAVCAADVDALVAHGQFLADKFGSGSSLSIAPGPGQ